MSVLFGMKHSIMGLEFEKTRRDGFRKTCFIDKQGPEKKKRNWMARLCQEYKNVGNVH